jgi:N-acetylglucosaminyldiphosphoundecaprenol N-acetyl-beta-D-mannosaminyltransferase
MAATALAERPAAVEILGVPVHRVSMDETLVIFARWLNDDGVRVVVTADSSGVVRAQADEEFRGILLGADLVTPDSSGILWAARRKGARLKERVSGVDLVDRLCALSAEKGHKLYFLGAAPGVAEMAAERMRLAHPGCRIVGARHGYFPGDSDEIVAREIAEKSPDVLLVAMGIPRQEKFIWRARDIIRAKISIGVGGSFDVFSGRAKRAPKWVQRACLEWLWRLMLNPRKLAKAKSLPAFVWLVMRSGR